MSALTDSLVSQLQQQFGERLLQLGDGQQAIRESGQGQAIVLLHGIGSGAASWLQVALGLHQRARVIAWDAPGYGQSAPLPMPSPRATDYAARLASLLEALEVERCVLVGHSLGAMTAAAFAQRHPERVSELVLLSPARGYGARPEQGQAVREKRLHDLATLRIERIAEMRSANLVSANASEPALAWVRWNMTRLNPPGYRQAIELLCGDDLLHYRAQQVPCQVHCGSADSITTADDCRALAQAFAAPFQLIHGAGHACAIEQPETVTGRLARALDTSFTGSVQ
ncbi:TPA: alpha/beta hydrolase [Pseudomonas putida]|uniref:alpha/beta fold hydrolase n=1 Tax=Pseudomonas putida TaxID=303 RepID=UPI00236486EE|nr:alpha/beta hydrolase [Pseudomonas putida]MDD2153790.1 alpha/beta hydrolase [Pseudomonas putida]HDS1683722.1 alpha/beta hydrolase [Pseudomonas putida]